MGMNVDASGDPLGAFRERLLGMMGRLAPTLSPSPVTSEPVALNRADRRRLERAQRLEHKRSWRNFQRRARSLAARA